jgi:hypothetical protein
VKPLGPIPGGLELVQWCNNASLGCTALRYSKMPSLASGKPTSKIEFVAMPSCRAGYMYREAHKVIGLGANIKTFLIIAEI